MHELALEQRRELGVRAPWHVGDITWGLRQHEGREHEWRIRIWKDGDRTAAWSWLKGDRALLDFDVRRDRLDLLDEIPRSPTHAPRSPSTTTWRCARRCCGTASPRTATSAPAATVR